MTRPGGAFGFAPRRARAGLVAGSIALACIVGSGCGSDDTAGGAEESETVGAEMSAALDRLAGRYAHYDVVAYEDPTLNIMIISYGFTDYERIGDRLESRDTFCFSEARTDQPIEVSFSDAATQAIKPVPVDVVVTVTDGRAHLARPETPTGIGIRLEDPANESLPTDRNDPRISDDDDDGKPGVTAKVKASADVSAELYIARREIFAYEVDEQPGGSLTGVVKDRSEQLIIGASDPLFDQQSEWVQYSDLTKSPIILEPVDASWDCERLRAERDAIFPPTPTVDY